MSTADGGTALRDLRRLADVSAADAGRLSHFRSGDVGGRPVLHSWSNPSSDLPYKVVAVTRPRPYDPASALVTIELIRDRDVAAPEAMPGAEAPQAKDRPGVRLRPSDR